MALLRKPEPVENPMEPRVAELEATMRLMKLEWAETLDRIEHLIRRLGKRQRDLDRLLTAEQDVDTPEPPSSYDQITERIHARRAARRVRQSGD